MYEFIGNKFTNHTIETPIYCNNLYDIDIATINFQGKITRSSKVWYWLSNPLDQYTKNIVNKVCYQFCGWIQIFTNVESTIVTAFLNLRCKFLKSCSPPIHAMTMPLIDNDAPILQLQCKFLVFE